MNSVLIVEDEKAIAELIEMTLEPFGYACVKAFDGEQAADLVEREAFDLILLDVMLPGVDGFSLMEYPPYRYARHFSHCEILCGGSCAGTSCWSV